MTVRSQKGDRLTHLPEFECLDEALLNLLRLIDSQGDDTAPRGMKTKELLNIGFKLNNPKARLVLNQARRWSLPLAVGEFLWHFSGRNDTSSISHYAPRWADFADGEAISSSCYGHKIFRPVNGGLSQWDIVVNLLRSDPSTRRAMINLYDPAENTLPQAIDVACTCSLQFLIRNGRLHLTVYMRSNDAIWGLPYDCFIFTMLQELMARQLEVSLGDYVHFATSLHVYERHFSLVERILSTPAKGDERPMPSMPSGMQRDLLLHYEEAIRCNGPIFDFRGLDPYWQDLLLVLSFHKARKLGESEQQQRTIEQICEPVYRDILAHWDVPMSPYRGEDETILCIS